LLLVFTCACSIINYQLFKGLEGRVDNQPTSTPAPSFTVNPTGVGLAKPEQLFCACLGVITIL
jgi:hypothetical protein